MSNCKFKYEDYKIFLYINPSATHFFAVQARNDLRFSFTYVRSVENTLKFLEITGDTGEAVVFKELSERSARVYPESNYW